MQTHPPTANSTMRHRLSASLALGAALLLATSCAKATDAEPRSPLLDDAELRRAARERFARIERKRRQIQSPVSAVTVAGVEIGAVPLTDAGASGRLVSAYVVWGPPGTLRLRVLDLRRERLALAEGDLKLAGVTEPQLLLVVAREGLAAPSLRTEVTGECEAAILYIETRDAEIGEHGEGAPDALEPESNFHRVNPGEPTVVGLWSWNGYGTALVAAGRTMEYGGHLTGSVPVQLGPNWQRLEEWKAPLLGLSVEVLRK